MGGVVVIAALLAGWWAIDRVQEHLPGPLNAVIDTFQNAGAPYGAPVIDGFDESAGQDDPLAACPDFAADVRALSDAVAASSTISQAQMDANNELIAAEIKRIGNGGRPIALARSGAASALRDQAISLDAMAGALRRTEVQTPEARSLATGIATAAVHVSHADREFIAAGRGDEAAWQAWIGAVSGPMQQVEVASRGLGKCPE